jgi:hypothetical protein
MRRVVFVVLVAALVGGLVVVDVAARRFAEKQVGVLVARNIGSAGMTHVRVRAFPFLPPLVAAGRVGRIVVVQDDVAAGPLLLDEVTVDLRHVDLDRNRLFQREAVVESIGSGTVHASVSEATLSSLTQVPVQLHPGKASATVAGRSVAIAISVSAGQLVVAVAGRAVLRVSIPELPLLPCVSNARVLEGTAELSCQIDSVPVGLLRRATGG